ncbi:MAG: class I SAM-dependent methyltransferase [Actinomycetota bacterium]
MDEARIEEFMGTVVGYMTGGAMCLAMWLGDELGIYSTLAAAGPLTADDVATKTNCNPRLIRELLDSNAAAHLLDYDDANDTYSISPEGTMALADDNSPAFVARAMNAFGSFFMDFDKIKAAYQSPSGGLSWGDHDHRLFSGTEWFFRPGYRTFLPTMWIPALDGVVAKLEAGAKVADVGCGHGASAIVMAETWPNSNFYGFDFHGPSIDASKERAKEAGVANTTFAIADAKGYDGTYDLICFFDCLHDMGDPVGIAKYAREHLEPGGTILLVEPYAHPDRVENMRENPMAPMMYLASAVICTPNSLSQDVGLGLGAAAGADKLKQVFIDAGFSHFRVAEETPMNLVIEAKA